MIFFEEMGNWKSIVLIFIHIEIYYRGFAHVVIWKEFEFKLNSTIDIQGVCTKTIAVNGLQTIERYARIPQNTTLNYYLPLGELQQVSIFMYFNNSMDTFLISSMNIEGNSDNSNLGMKNV